MKKPIIGLTPQVDYDNGCHRVLPTYVNSILDAGGVPVMLPMTDDLQALESVASVCDGFLFTGGHDMHPSYYGEENLYCNPPATERDLMEMAFLKVMEQTDKPVFGICRGIQTLNVYFGGTLYQDVVSCGATQRDHRMEKPYERTEHKAFLEEDGPLYAMFGEKEILVNSVHHQAVKAIAPGFRCMARSEDGLVEGIYRPDKPFFMAVQWHPEWMYEFDQNSVRLFRAFIDACKA